MAMHDCDLMINIGARFDDRITGRIDAFSPNSKKAHIDIDPSSINKVIHVDIPIIGDVAHVLEDLLAGLEGARTQDRQGQRRPLVDQDPRLAQGRVVWPLFRQEGKTIKPQYALQRLEELTKDHDRYICTEVGQHQMWAAQYHDVRGAQPLDDLGRAGHDGLRVSGLDRGANGASGRLVINVAGEASWLMNMQEMGTAVQFRAPVKQFILNNERLGMVRQWQELLHGERYSHSWSEALPDFVKLAEAFGAKGIYCRATLPRIWTTRSWR